NLVAALARAVAARHEAAVAERRPRRGARAAGAAAADRRVLDLRAELVHDTRRRRFLERGSLLDRDAGDTRILQREPAQDRRLARSLLRLGQARRVQPLRIEQPREHRL